MAKLRGSFLERKKWYSSFEVENWQIGFIHVDHKEEIKWNAPLSY